MKRVLSGMRPTGKLHLGNLVGALNNWVKLQDSYRCFYMIADWHALMSEYQNPKDMKDNTYEVVRDFVASGIDTERSTVFVQSHVPEHLELAMIFSDLTPLAWVERCPTYKEQLRELKGREITTYGFLGYPVLQAADIAIYKADYVPVGVDQLPHLELTREILRRFNTLYHKKLFPEPEPILTKTPKLLGIDNRKMSKSYMNYILLSDPSDVIERKISQMITDPERIKLTDKGHPDICNVFTYYSTFADSDLQKDVKSWCENAKLGCTGCKKRLAKILIDYIEPIRENRKMLSDSKIEHIITEGAKKAREVTSKTILEVKRLINLVI